MGDAGPILRKTGDGYDVLAGETIIGEVYRERQSGWGNRGSTVNHSDYRHGHTRWVHSHCSDEDFATRREAVADLLRRNNRAHVE